MRIPWRTTRSALLRDVALVCLADGIVGVAFGAATVASGLSWWVPIVMSLLIYAGGAQIAAVGVVLAGGGPLAAVAAGAVVNIRLFPYGLAVADIFSDGAPVCPARGQWWKRLLGAHVITDESVAFALRSSDPTGRRTAFWTCGLTLFAVWNASVVLGVLIGSMMKNPDVIGLDATFPAVLLALALPALADRRTRLSAGTGAAIAVALTPVLPAGLPVLAALGGLGAAWRPRRRERGTRRGRRPARHDREAEHDRQAAPPRGSTVPTAGQAVEKTAGDSR